MSARLPTARRPPALALATLCAGLAALALPAAPAAAELTVRAADERPLRGEVVRLEVTDDGRPAAGARLVAVYRPNSSTSYREALPPVDSSGTVLWTPKDAGPVRLEARAAEAGGDDPAAATLTVTVRFRSFPPSGMLIMILAGVLLLGGAAFGFVMLMAGPGPLPAEEPPST